MSSPLTAEDRQRLTTIIEDLQIELGYLRQCGRDIIERTDVIKGQLKNITILIDQDDGHQAIKNYG